MTTHSLPALHRLTRRAAKPYNPPMKTIFRMTLVPLLAGILGCTAASLPTAQQVLDSAKAQAGARHRDVFIIFGASW